MLILTLLLAAVAVAAPTSRLVVHEKRRSPEAINSRQKVDREAIIPVRIAPKQTNINDGYKHLMDVSDPTSLNYGKHWTVEEIHAKFAPSEDSVKAVKEWLAQSGFHQDDVAETASKGWLGVDMSVRDAERLFGAEYYEHEDDDGNIRIGCDIYHVPSHLSHHIDHVKPGIMVSAPLQKVKARSSLGREASLNMPTNQSTPHVPSISPTSLATCGEFITPACIKALYGIPNAKLNQSQNTLGIFESEDTYDQKDLDLYFSNYAPWVPSGTHPTLVSINHAKAPVPINSSSVQGESVVDFDLAFSLLYPQTVTLYQTQATNKQLRSWVKEYGVTKASGLNLIEPFLDAVDGPFCTKLDREAGAECGAVELARVLSVSYSVSELQFPEAAARRACAEYMKLALKGHTLIVSSGDYGPAGHIPALSDPRAPLTNGCINPNHIDNTEANGTVFSPQFPPSCPFITSVGATQLDRNASVEDHERAMLLHSHSDLPVFTFSTSGGISNYFAAPEYQKCALDTYFKEHNPGYPTYDYNGMQSVGDNGGIYARGGRGIPDVSANGAHLAVFTGGEFVPGGQAGTSLATPIFASVITMINQERTAAGKGPVGFINPVIYKHPEIFNDITFGDAPGCGTKGFSAVEGWDPTTGLGTPNYPKMLEVFMSLP